MARYCLYLSVVLSLSAALVGPGAAQPSERFAGPSQRTSTGAAADGFSLALITDTPKVQLGAPIWVTLEIRNVTRTTQYAWAGSRHAGFAFTIIDVASGKSLQRNPYSTFGLDSIGGPFQGMAIPTGTSIYLKFRLDSLYEFSRAGTYSVRATKAQIVVNGREVLMPPSNAVMITVS